MRKHFDFVARTAVADDEGVAIDDDSAGKLAVRGIVAGQVGVGVDRTKIVDRNDLDIMFFMALVVGTENVAADAAVAIDGDADGHVVFLANECGKKGLGKATKTVNFTAMVIFAQIGPQDTR